MAVLQTLPQGAKLLILWWDGWDSNPGPKP
jgi:hypothetical protein